MASDFKHQRDCVIHQQAQTHIHTLTVQFCVYMSLCTLYNTMQTDKAGNPEMQCYLIYREVTCTRNTTGSCVRVSRQTLCMCVYVCVMVHRGGGGGGGLN